jgi:hypothetical protein
MTRSGGPFAVAKRFSRSRIGVGRAKDTLRTQDVISGPSNYTNLSNPL